MKPFIYLVQAARSMPDYPGLMDPACDVLLLTWQTPAPQAGALFAPDTSWNEGRNRLLWEARKRSAASGNDYLYYIFLDDDCRLREDEALAARLSLPLTGNPFRTFERFLLEWEPALGYTRYDWQHCEADQPVNLGHNIDALLNAFHRETIDFLLPYYTGFDSESWLYSQHLLNHLVSLFFHPYRIQCNTVRTTNTRRRGYAQRKKYWQIPTHFLCEALQEPLRPALNTADPNRVRPAPGAARRKDRSYRIAPETLQRNFHVDHPLVAHRRLAFCAPEAPRRLGPQPRIAVCLSGRCSGLDQTHRNLRTHLLNRLPSCDLFMYVPQDEYAHLAPLLEPTALEVAQDRQLPEGPLVNGVNCLLKVGVQAYLQQLYGLKMVDRLRQQHEARQGQPYDAVIRCRPDVLFEAPLPDLGQLDLRYLHVPDFHMYEGCNDRFAIGNAENMTKYMNKLDEFAAYVTAWSAAHPAAPPVTAEMFTAGQLRRHGILVRRLAVRFNRVRPHKIKPDTLARR